MKTNSDPVKLIKEKINIKEVIDEYIELKPSGDRFVGFCPFHKNVNTPAFTIYPDQGRWVCYGCDRYGDLFTFVEMIEGIEFKDVLKRYAKRLDIPLGKVTKKMREARDRHEKLYEILAETTTYFYNSLNWRHDEGGQAREYLKSRGIDSQTIAQFVIGYASDDWNDLLKHLRKKGYPTPLLLDAGIAAKKGRRTYNFFRHRIMFPISMNGTTLGFAGRSLIASDSAKYLNSPTTEVFNKSKILYGLPQARESIRKLNTAILVEGYMDVIALHQQGITNAVSIMGTSISDDQAKSLKFLTNKIILALDSDDAGRQAITRLKVEKISGVDIYIAELPKGKDPDDIVLKDRNEWDKIISSALPIPIYLTNILVDRSKNLDDPKEKRKIVNRVARTIEHVRDPHEQAGYQEYLAKAVGYKKYRINTRCPHCGEKYYETS